MVNVRELKMKASLVDFEIKPIQFDLDRKIIGLDCEVTVMIGVKEFRKLKGLHIHITGEIVNDLVKDITDKAIEHYQEEIKKVEKSRMELE